MLSQTLTHPQTEMQIQKHTKQHRNIWYYLVLMHVHTRTHKYVWWHSNANGTAGTCTPFKCVYVWVYEWMVLWVAQQQLLYSKQRWIYSLINKSWWMSMQMEACARALPSQMLYLHENTSSIHELTRSHSPSVCVWKSLILAVFRTNTGTHTDKHK